MKELVQKAWDHFNNMKLNTECYKVLVNTMPILYFGDLNAYNDSELKIMTVGLNPSDSEFTDDKQNTDYSFFRFAAAESLKDYNDSYISEDAIDLYLKSLNDYFKIENPEFKANPYTDWFNKNEKLLSGLKASYYKKSGCNYTTIHTDVCTPIATRPTWSGLSNKVKKLYINEGRTIWNELLEKLEPNIVLLSAGNYHVKIDGKIMNPFNFVDPKRIIDIEIFEEYLLKSDGTPRNVPHIIEMHRYTLKSGKITHIYFDNGENGYFASVGNRKKALGEKIYNYAISNIL